MPPLTRWFIKSALVCLVAALLMALLLTARSTQALSPLYLSPFLSALFPVYLHLFMVGWVTQLIFGVSYWMFPRYSREQPRGNETVALLTYVTINLGLILRAVGEPLHALHPGRIWGALLILSALLQWMAGVGYLAMVWGRVKAR